MGALSDIASAFYKPQVNPDAYGVDAQGNVVDKTGKPVPVYTQPNWFERALDPQAKQIAGLNAQYAASPLLGQQGRAQSRSLAGMDYNTFPDNVKALFPNQDSAVTFLGDNPTAGNVLSQGTALAGINAGLPGLRAASEAASNRANIPLMANQQTLQQRLAANGTPTTQADATGVQALNALISGTGENGLIPQRLKLEGSQLAGANAAQPNINQETLNRSLIGASTTGQGVQDLPLSNLTTRANDLSSAYQAQRPTSLVSSPFAGTVDPYAGTVIPGHTLQNTIMGQALGQMGGGGVTAPSGTMYTRPATPINPLAMSPSGILQSPTNDYSVDSSGKLYRKGIPVDEAGEEPLGNNPAKPQTLGQRLLSHIPNHVTAGIPNPHARAAQLAASHAIQQHQQDTSRIQELTNILTNPPTQMSGKRGSRVSVYTQQQLQDMADELDKLTGSK